MKKFNINVQTDRNSYMDPFKRDSYLTKDEYPHIYLNEEITDEDFDKALDVVMTYFMQKQISYVTVNLEERNYEKSPVKTMTLDDIEKELGHRIKIVNTK